MKHHKTVAFLLVFPAAVLLHAKEKKPIVSAVFNQARYVYVEAVDGREFDPNLYPEDREAIADVRDALTNWNRYVLTTEREQADLVIVVRKGRLASADAGVSANGGQDPSGGSGQVGAQVPSQRRAGGQMGGPGNGSEIGPGNGPGIRAGGEMGPPDDLFEVCQINPNGKLSNPLWEHSMPDGLDAPRVLLFRQFREAVEKAYPQQAASQPQKP
jgi:hypothetical protein